MGGAIISGGMEGERSTRGGSFNLFFKRLLYSPPFVPRRCVFTGSSVSFPCFDSLHVFRGATRNAGTIKRGTTTVTVFGEGEKADKYTECMK